MTWLQTIAGGAVGGGIVALFGLSRTGQIVQITGPEGGTTEVRLAPTPVRQWRGYPSLNEGAASDFLTEHLVVPPVGRKWRILNLYWQIYAGALAGTREPLLRLRRRGADIEQRIDWRLPAYVASDYAQFIMGPGYDYATWNANAAGTRRWYTLPLPYEGVLVDEQLEFLIVSGQLGDTHRVAIVYEESDV